MKLLLLAIMLGLLTACGGDNNKNGNEQDSLDELAQEVTDPLDETDPEEKQESPDSDGEGQNEDTGNENSPEQPPVIPNIEPRDSDEDGTPDDEDAFPNDPSEQLDTDQDGTGDNSDAFPNDASEQLDSDQDGTGDNSDAFPNDASEQLDSDQDGTGDNSDAFPNDASEQVDSDQDGTGDNSDAFPNDASEQLDSDEDGTGDNSDAFPNDASEQVDSDQDGTGDNSDAFPNDASEQVDSDQDGTGDNSDAFPNDASEQVDSDQDGTGDNSDAFPNDASEQVDSDQDGTGDNSDAFPNDASEQLDSDQDGTGDNSDAFPNDASEQVDSDQDGTGDNSDAFPNDASEQLDSDEDGTGDNSDAFPNDASEQLDSDEDGVGDNADPAPQDDTITVAIPFATQNLDSFHNGQSWYTTNFGLDQDASRSDYVTEDGEILFAINWTKRSRNMMADELGMERSDMSNEVAHSLCPAALEVGRASTYGTGDSSNMIAELDSDLRQCNMGFHKPATLRLRSFIPTKVGYKYAASVQYQMRSYNMPNNAYRHFVMRFGKQAEHFEPVFGEFATAKIEITALRKFSPLVMKDNGLPDSYGILIDHIHVTELGKVDHYDDCASLFAENSKGFRKCIAGEVDTEQSCTMDNMTVSKYVMGPDVAESRQNTDMVFVDEAAHNGNINFLALGKKGRVKMNCMIDGYAATYPIFNQQLSLREITWGNATPESYPEQARIIAHLSHCADDNLNGRNHLGLVSTGEEFSYDFTQDPEGTSYEGCRLKSLIVKDKTPASSPSPDGFDLNSVSIKAL